MGGTNAPEAKPVRSTILTVAAYAVFVVLVVIATFVVAEAALAEKAHTAETVHRTGTLMQVAALRQNVVEAESAIERYLLFEKEEYLTEYRQLAVVIERRVLDMKSSAAVDTRERPCIESLTAHIHRRFSLMDSWIELAKNPASRATLAQTVDEAVDETQTIKRLLVELEGEQYRALARIRADR